MPTNNKAGDPPGNGRQSPRGLTGGVGLGMKPARNARWSMPRGLGEMARSYKIKRVHSEVTACVKITGSLELTEIFRSLTVSRITATGASAARRRMEVPRHGEDWTGVTAANRYADCLYATDPAGNRCCWTRNCKYHGRCIVYRQDNGRLADDGLS